MSYCSTGLRPGPFGRDDEGHGIHAKSRDPKLNPKSHDLQNFRLNVRVGGIQIRLEIVETVEVPGAGDRIVSSKSISARPGNTMPLLASRGFFFDQTYQSRYLRIRVSPRLLEPGVLVGCMVDHQIDDDANAPLLGGMREFDKVAQRPVARIDFVIVGNS